MWKENIQPKKVNQKLSLKKYQDIESTYKEPISKEGSVFPTYKEPISKEGSVFPIFKMIKVIKRPKLIGKATLRKIKRPTIIIDTIDRRYFNPIT